MKTFTVLLALLAAGPALAGNGSVGSAVSGGQPSRPTYAPDEYESEKQAWRSYRVSAEEVLAESLKKLANRPSRDCDFLVTKNPQGEAVLTIRERTSLKRSQSIVINRAGYHHNFPNGSRTAGGIHLNDGSYSIVYADSDDRTQPRKVLQIQNAYATTRGEPLFNLKITPETYATAYNEYGWITTAAVDYVRTNQYHPEDEPLQCNTDWGEPYNSNIRAAGDEQSGIQNSVTPTVDSTGH